MADITKIDVWEFFLNAEPRIFLEIVRMWYGDISPIIELVEDSIDKADEGVVGTFFEAVKEKYEDKIKDFIKKREKTKKENKYVIINGTKIVADKGQTPQQLVREWARANKINRAVVVRVSKKHGEKPISDLRQIRWRGTYQVLKEVV